MKRSVWDDHLLFCTEEIHTVRLFPASAHTEAVTDASSPDHTYRNTFTKYCSRRRSKEEYDLEMMALGRQEREDQASTSSSLSDAPLGNSCETQAAGDSGTRQTNTVRADHCHSDVSHVMLFTRAATLQSLS